MQALAEYASKGQYVTSGWLDAKRSKGDAARGKLIFRSLCKRCHGADGRMLNFKTAANPEFPGTIASISPWEFAHKVRNGQPATPMGDYLFLRTDDLSAHTADAQTLPTR